MKIGVFCSANYQLEPAIFQQTKELGRWMGKSGHTLVFGGCSLGLMETVARACHEAGGRTVGVVPTIVEQRGDVSRHVDELIRCTDLTDRKQLMERHSDVFVALPGGIGTLDEVFTIAAAATIGYHRKHVVLYNINGFWDSLVAMLDDLHQRGVTRKQWRSYLTVARTLSEVIQAIEAHRAANPEGVTEHRQG